MFNKAVPFLPLIALGLLIALVCGIGYLFDFHPEAEEGMHAGIWVSQTAGLFMLLYAGSFIKTMAFKMAVPAAVAALVGVLFKIMHWPFASTILWISLFALAGVYTWHFFNKAAKSRLDYLKLLWVLITAANMIVQFQHLWQADLRIVSSAIVWLCIIDFLKTNRILNQLIQRK